VLTLEILTMPSEKKVSSPPVTVDQLLTALSCVLDACDRVSADPKSVVRWTNQDLVVISAARSLCTPPAAPEGGAQ
jgi:hypothetical protein